MQFTVKLILSFIVGGIYITGITWLTQKVGASIGAAVAGIPSTLLISLIFINITLGPQDVKEATSFIPVLIVVSMVYGYVFVMSLANIKSSNKLILSALVASIVWLFFGILSRTFFSSANFFITVITAAVLTVFFNYLFSKYKVVKPKPVNNAHKVWLVRFIVSGTVVFLSVLISKLAGPTWGGIFAGFPVSVATTTYFFYIDQGLEFTKGYLKNLPFAIVSTIVYIIVLHNTLLKMNTVLSFSIAMLTALIYSGFNVVIKNHLAKKSTLQT